MKADPFRIEGPAMISFSGGRTSAYMLWRIIQAHGGELPPDIHVVFANTGKEREETLRFVHEVSSRWEVKVNWVEWRGGTDDFEQVGFNSASRNGEPFRALIDKKKRLPNGRERWCTQFLKVMIMFAFMREHTGLEPGQYAEVIGMRDDEGIRVLKGLDKAAADGRVVKYPLANAKIRKADVMAFWLGQNTDPKNLLFPLPQGFDLGLLPWEGNCDLCFQKGKGIKLMLLRDNPASAEWWDKAERDHNGWFSSRHYIRDLSASIRQAPSLFDAPAPDEADMEYDVECGTNCATE